MEKKIFHDTVASKGTFLGIRADKEVAFPTLKRVLKLLEKRGWLIQTDQRILKEYSCLAKDYWEGKKGDLRLKTHRYPAGFEIEFYQEVNVKNSNGGYYDFDKLKMMPYLIRCQFLIELKHIKHLLIDEGYEEKSKSSFKNAIDEVLFHIKDSCHYKDGKENPEFIIPAYNATDKDGKQILNGQIKFFRDYKGRLLRGIVYHNINNMWWVVINKFEFTNVASYELFDFESFEVTPKKVFNSSNYRMKKAREDARQKFSEVGLTYKDINDYQLDQLREILQEELAAYVQNDTYGKEMGMSLSKPLKKDTKILKRTGLQYAQIKVDGSYFSKREGITFNKDGFIGFCGWADIPNTTVITTAFCKWCDRIAS